MGQTQILHLVQLLYDTIHFILNMEITVRGLRKFLHATNSVFLFHASCDRKAQIIAPEDENDRV